MAEHALTTPRRSHEPARGALDRRTICAAVFAAIISSGVTAGIAASAADLVPADPDTALVALCTRYVDRTRAERASVDAMTEHERRAYYWASVRDRDRVDELVEQIAAMPAQGADGRAAKARALIWYYGGSDDHDPFGWRREDALLASLVADVGGRAAA